MVVTRLLQEGCSKVDTAMWVHCIVIGTTQGMKLFQPCNKVGDSLCVNITKLSHAEYNLAVPSSPIITNYNNNNNSHICSVNSKDFVIK